MIKVVVVDDETLVRSGIQMILNSSEDLLVVATADGPSAVEVVRRERPNVVLLDIRMPQVDGLAVLRQIQKMSDPPHVGMLTTFDADEYVLTALRSGASGFLLKDTEPDELIQLVRTLAAGGIVLSPRASCVLLRIKPETAARQGAELARVRLLSKRERDVLVLIGEGFSNPEISALMYLGVGTVKDHVSSILSKLRVSSRVQAVLVAERAGLLRKSAATGDPA
ncbi:response regulator transcription factor [Streptomyces rubiginosohelvolus]|uniref:response regulator transcription factor n=1 Tax=Streptomyces rubiginosohelvolus TaxID=67362 RepID=UPI003432C6A7